MVFMLDDEGTLRVSGRLKHAILDADQQHPVILPPQSHLTHLVIDAAHRRTFHGGVQATLAHIKQRFWIPRRRQLVRRHIHSCHPCVRWRAATPRPKMGDLPRPRVTPSRPFQHTGVDLAGPVWLRTTRGRGHKAYKGFLVVFVCFSSRAARTDSSGTSSRLLAVRSTLLSGTLQTEEYGGASIHRQLHTSAACGKQLSRLSSITCDAPSARPDTFEELSTFLTEVEACLNSRPFEALTDDPDDLDALTPEQFLVGDTLFAIPEPSLLDFPTNRLNRWRLLQQMRDHLWQRWTREYLQYLSPRPKWWATRGAILESQLCLVRGENTLPCRWPLALVTRVHSGNGPHNGPQHNACADFELIIDVY
ncbi:uncharacterized protein LOC114932809 [Nylanderia fulva]|uniref:uncharacterized protein LOC114932809 n=1 Tax=Nylanderia fulva TaxID=613905 RepID=UPI0010FAEF7D|nr:uncharacterized protein LOC114932809 [Nylanderia fulva]